MGRLDVVVISCKLVLEVDGELNGYGMVVRKMMRNILVEMWWME